MITNDLVKLNHDEYFCGIWLFKTNGNFQLKGFYKDGLINLLANAGFRKIHRGSGIVYVRNIDNILSEVSIYNIQDFVKVFLDSLPNEITYNINTSVFVEKKENLKNKFLDQSNLVFNNSFLNNLPEVTTVPLRDTLNSIYLPFNNGFLSINKKGHALIPYSKLEKYHFFKEQVINHSFVIDNKLEQSQFEKFIINVCDGDAKRIAQFESALGYLIHSHNDSAQGKAVICYDGELTDGNIHLGGTGKGIFVNAIKQVRSVAHVDGKKFDTKDKFAFQEVSLGTQVVSIEDVNVDFKFERLNSLLTDGFSVEQKHRLSYTIKPEEAPKIIITSNIILNNEGTTYIRRQLILEFGNYYSKQIKTGVEEPIIKEHGKRFYSEWDKSEWDRFYEYIVKCSTNYLKNGLQYIEPINLKLNRLLQQTNQEFVEWVNSQNFDINHWYSSKELFTIFKNLYYPEEHEFKQRGFSTWLKLYAKSKNFSIEFKTINGENKFRLIKI